MVGRHCLQLRLILGFGILAAVGAGCGTGAQDTSATHPNQLPHSDLVSSADASQSVAASTAAALRELVQQFALPTQTRGVTLIFVLPDCPIANSYAAEYSRLSSDFASRGIPLIVVYVDPDLTSAQMAEHANQYLLKCPVLLDSQLTWANRAGATKTPEAAVFDLHGGLLYRGRIDDRYAAVGKSRAIATTHDLRTALEAILAGKPVAQRFTDAVGCHIPAQAHEGTN